VLDNESEVKQGDTDGKKSGLISERHQLVAVSLKVWH
jgi:hypothetical protein